MELQPWRARLGLVAGAAASGILTALVPPSRLSAPVRRSVHVGLGLSVGVSTAWVLGRPDDDPAADGQVAVLPLPVRLGLPIALGSLVALTSAAGMSLDTATERALTRRGVRHPRVWIGVATAVLTAATSWTGRDSDDDPTTTRGRPEPDGA